MGKGEIARYEQFLLFPQFFSKVQYCRHVKTRACLAKSLTQICDLFMERKENIVTKGLNTCDQDFCFLTRFCPFERQLLLLQPCFICHLQTLDNCRVLLFGVQLNVKYWTKQQENKNYIKEDGETLGLPVTPESLVMSLGRKPS